MAKYLLLKHYRGGPERSPQGCVPMEDWTPQEISDHVGFMHHVQDTLAERGELVEGEGAVPGWCVRAVRRGGQAAGDGWALCGDEGTVRWLLSY